MASIQPEECVDRIIALRSIESRSYECIDYLDYLANTPGGMKKSSMLEQHRQRICTWMYQLLDTCNINREIVYYSMNLLDRFMSNIISNYEKVQNDVDMYIGGSQYELASLTSLYIAMKLNGSQSQPVRISRFEMLSRGKFSDQDICNMEMKMLTGLCWHVFPPSPAEYVENFISLLSYFHCRIEDKPSPSFEALNPIFDKMLDISIFLTELAVCDYFFVTENASTTAFASVLISMERFEDYVSGKEYAHFLTVLETVGLRQDLYGVEICRERLQELYSQNVPDVAMCDDGEPDSERMISSPVSVTQI